MNNKYFNLIIATVLIVIAATSRVVLSEAHLYNFAPIGALGLFSGAVIKDKRYAFLLPLLAQFGADVYFQFFTNTPGFYNISQFFTYAGLAAATLLGTRMKLGNTISILGYSLGASSLFFLFSNLGFFAEGWNGYSLQGLAKTFIDAIPFYKNTLAGDLIGSIVLFFIFSKLTNTNQVEVSKA